MEKRNERNVYLFLLLVLCLVSFGLGYYLFKHQSRHEIKQVPINDSITLNVAPLKIEDTTITKSYVGYVEAINQVQIIPYISGYLKSISAQAGQTVQENDLLVTIDPQEYKARLDAADAAVLQAKSSLEYNRNYYERVQKSGNRAFSEIEISNAKNNFLQAEATLKNAVANKELALVNYNYTVIKAPISGLIGNFTLSPGDYVTPNGGALLSIVQTNPIRVVFSLTDVEYLNLSEDGALFKDSVISLKLPNGKTFEYTGEFKYTNNEINKSTNSLAVYSYFKNDNNELLPNAYVTVEVSTTFKSTVLVSKSLIKMLADGNFISIVRHNEILSHKVKILSDKGSLYVLENNFKENDLLLLDDVSNLKKDAKINFKLVKQQI